MPATGQQIRTPVYNTGGEMTLLFHCDDDPDQQDHWIAGYQDWCQHLADHHRHASRVRCTVWLGHLQPFGQEQ